VVFFTFGDDIGSKRGRLLTSIIAHTSNEKVYKLIEAGAKDGWSISILTQPPQSPDLHILDLGLFHSLNTFISEGALWKK
jgi:hypothetical protein